MAKFQNTTGFNQVAIYSGKKHWVRKDWVIEAPDNFMQEGFEKVADNTTVSSLKTRFKPAGTNDVEQVEKRLQALEKTVAKLDSTSTESVDALQEKISGISEQALKLEEGASKDVVELKELVESLAEQLEQKTEYIQAMRETMLKRLEILKTAMQAMEQQMDDLTGYNEGN